MRLQRREASAHPAHAPAIVNEILRSPGRPLDAAARSFMEPRFGRDFSHVRVHDGARAAQSAAAVNARAYAVGRDLVFAQGEYSPASERGRRLLAHELSHVEPEKATVRRLPAELPIGAPSDPAEREADAVADRVISGSAGRSTLGASGDSHAIVRRSCTDGKCDSCPGGSKVLRLTAFFRRRANKVAMDALRTEINAAKTILKNCCCDLKLDFNFSRVPGSATVPATAADAGETTGGLYSKFETELGTGKTFAGARGVPMLVVDDVPGSGGGVTVDPRADQAYKGAGYIIIALFPKNSNSSCNSIAHELWHAAGQFTHDAQSGQIPPCTGNAVSLPYCTAVRTLATGP